jgi:hypothetical protein
MGAVYAHAAFAASLVFAVFAAFSHRDQAVMAETRAVPARIEKTWYEPGKYPRHFAQISYQREMPVGTVNCDVAVHLGGNFEGITTGQTVPVIPRSYSCHQPLLVEPRARPGTVLTLAAISFLLSAFFLFAHVQHHRGAHALGRDTM